MNEVELPCGRSFFIDAADLTFLEGFRAHSEARGRTRYVRLRRMGQRAGGVYLHNLIMGGRADHRDGDGLNNTRSNLRLCTQAQNGLNRAPKAGKRFKGVYQHRSGRFYAQIARHGVVTSSQPYETEDEAARAYDDMAMRLHGEWAWLNFPEDQRKEPAFRWLDRTDNRQAELF